MHLRVLPLITLALLVSPTTADASPCLEDEPCWSWAKMGNGQRGVTTVDGRELVVGTCRFQRLWYAKRIRYGGPGARIERLKGDAWARRHGCGFDVQDY